MKLKLSQLKKLQGNPRTITKEDMNRLCESIRKFGIIEGRPLLISTRTGENVIIGGNQRYEACKILGINEVPVCILENLTPEEEKEIIIRDNISNGDWDMEQIANSWTDYPLEDWGLEIPSMDIEEEETKEEEKNKYDIIISCLNEVEQEEVMQKLQDFNVKCSKV